MKDLREFEDAHLRIFDRPEPPAPDEIESIYLIGICGTGMGSLAGLLKEMGYEVSGSDEAAYPPMSTQLRTLGIPIYEGYDADHLEPAPDMVIVGNACTPTHEEAAAARERGLTQTSMPEAIGHFFLSRRRSLVVAGTHGKTTTTGLLAHLLEADGRDPSYLIGGVMQGREVSNRLGEGPHFVIEGDEYDSAYFDKRPKFLHYRPDCAIVTSMEFDHADIYSDWDEYREAFERFAQSLPEDGLLVLCADDAEVRELASVTDAEVRLYGVDERASVRAENIVTESTGAAFDLVVDGVRQGRCSLPLSGLHNVQNALAAVAVAHHEGTPTPSLVRALGSFPGMRRRQELRSEVDGLRVVDDFAHHPSAVRETIASVRERWPNDPLIAIFEPRSNSSRRKVFEEEYAKAFDACERVHLSTPPVRHNDVAGEMMDASVVARRIEERGGTCTLHAGAESVFESVLADLPERGTLLVMSNGSFGNLPERLAGAIRDRVES